MTVPFNEINKSMIIDMFSVCGEQALLWVETEVAPIITNIGEIIPDETITMFEYLVDGFLLLNQLYPQEYTQLLTHSFDIVVSYIYNHFELLVEEYNQENVTNDSTHG